jgi:hypothetical protein
MNCKKVKLLASAKKDLREGFRFYERQEFGVGTYFVNTLSSEAMALQFTGGVHLKRGNLFRVKSKKFPYWIYYAIRNSVVYVIIILDARRSPEVIRKREKREQSFSHDSSATEN